METVPVKPISGSFLSSGREENSNFCFSSENDDDKKSTDDKIQDLALAKISYKSKGVLCGKIVVSVTSLQFYRFFSDAFTVCMKKKQTEKKYVEDRCLPQREHLKNKFYPLPIGIRAINGNNWLNALMQFILAIPSFRVLFDFAPRNFYLLNAFIDQYLYDQTKNELVTKADPLIVLQCLQREFFDDFGNLDQINLYDLVSLLIESIVVVDKDVYQYNKTSFRWHIVWKAQDCHCLSLYQHIADSIKELQKKEGSRGFYFSKSLLVAFKQNHLYPPHPAFQAKMQYFFSDKGLFSICYDLTTFIELRFDRKRSSSLFVTYVKVNGSWYQCDDNRVKCILSHHLSLPLSRGVLFFYNRIKFDRQCQKNLAV